MFETFRFLIHHTFVCTRCSPQVSLFSHIFSAYCLFYGVFGVSFLWFIACLAPTKQHRQHHTGKNSLLHRMFGICPGITLPCFWSMRQYPHYVPVCSPNTGFPVRYQYRHRTMKRFHAAAYSEKFSCFSTSGKLHHSIKARHRKTCIRLLYSTVEANSHLTG